MFRHLAIAAVLVALPVSASAALHVAGTDHDRAYATANARVARAVPRFPGARLLIAESFGGYIRDRPYQAFQRVYQLAQPKSQQAVRRFYLQKLGSRWQPRRDACLVSGSRLVAAVISSDGRRLGVVIDVRGARYCYDHVGIISDLLQVGYPD